MNKRKSGKKGRRKQHEDTPIDRRTKGMDQSRKDDLIEEHERETKQFRETLAKQDKWNIAQNNRVDERERKSRGFRCR